MAERFAVDLWGPVLNQWHTVFTGEDRAAAEAEYARLREALPKSAWRLIEIHEQSGSSGEPKKGKRRKRRVEHV